MQITSRQYPHPVLSPGSEDYKKSSFSIDTEHEIEFNNIKIKIKFNLNCPVLEKLVKEGKATYVTHLECGATRFRNKFSTNENTQEIILEGNKIKNKVEMTFFIIASEEIFNFSSNFFSDDFRGIDFQIHKGDILAVSYNKDLILTKSDDPFKRVPSIFSIVPLQEDDLTTIEWEPTQTNVIIKLSQTNYNNYREGIGNGKLEYILSMSIVIPVLTEILYDIQQSEDEYEGCIWYEVIRARLKQININTIADMENYGSKVKLAYKVLEGILEKSLSEVASWEGEE